MSVATMMGARKRGYSQRSLRPALYRPPKEPTEPFHVTVFKVGSTIFVLCAVFHLASLSIYSKSDNVPYREHLLVKHTIEESKKDDKITILPSFSLTEKSEHDAFAIAKQHSSQVKTSDTPTYIQQFLEEAEKLQRQFADRYGGKLSARALLERSLAVLKSDDSHASSNAMAFRIDVARQNSGIFSMAFGGSSAVAGYGNFHHQSFPFVVAQLLEALEILGLTLQVRNGAVEHTGVFPYTWCRNNYMGENLDVSSMDFGNISPRHLEAVIRNVAAQGDAPILVFRDSIQPSERKSLLQSYVDAGVLVDPLIIDLQAAFAPYANVKEELLPPGLQGWNEFSAPPGAPGKVRQNMTLKQHELYGWLLSMHILAGAQSVVQAMLNGSNLVSPPLTSSTLPRPILLDERKMSRTTPLLYGSPIDDPLKEWSMGSFQCATAFDPIVSGALNDIIMGGTYGDEVDLLHPKGAMYLSQGWVLDLEADERREKQLMKQWDNLGFQDYSKAYYGIPASGPLSAFLPIGGDSDVPKSAQESFKHLIVCESNAKGNSCNLERDVSIVVGGVKATSVQWIVNDAVTYHGKRLCVLVDIPEDSKLISKGEAKQVVVDRMQAKLKKQTRLLLFEGETTLGLAIEIEVTSSRVTWHKGACSIAHIIWEPR